MKRVDSETVRADSFQMKPRDNDNGFSISGYAAIPSWQELSVSGYNREIYQ
jgi:hypothetical protein